MLEIGERFRAHNLLKHGEGQAAQLALHGLTDMPGSSEAAGSLSSHSTRQLMLVDG